MGIRSMFSGVSGLQAHSTWLDVIGNNISNTNTVAYKASRVEFASQISQSMKSASGSNAASGLGGVNGMQVGLGSRVQSIQTLFTQGTTLNTGLNTDVMIDGNGFLISSVGGTNYYTRAGNLDTDGQGYLVDANGGMIQGWSARSTYTSRAINGAVGGANTLYVTDASLQLDTATSISNIQVKTGMACPAKATTELVFSGNLDAALKATDMANGGMIDLGSTVSQVAGGAVVANPAKIPFADAACFNGLNPLKTDLLGAPPTGGAGSVALHQIADFCLPDPAAVDQTVASSVVTTGLGIDLARNNVYIWDDANAMAQNPPVTFVTTVYDSNGLEREITFLMWQVNDLGDGGVNMAGGPNQAAYAWYAFDTTGGVKPNTGDNATSNLLGGTGVGEAFDNGTGVTFGVGDLLYFNTDGSLASQGGTNAGIIQQRANLFIPTNGDATGLGTANLTSPVPTIGAEILAISLNFGTSGILTEGQRDGLYSDAAGTYQTVNGVSTYVPEQTAYVADQDGYGAGILQSWSFDSVGMIQGVFSNGETIVLGQVAMANVQNQEGLVSVGNNYYTGSANSGAVYVGTAGTGGLGSMVGGALEGSNVDLTTELTNMIIAQRGFEVNAQSVRVGNEVLQTTVNLGR